MHGISRAHLPARGRASKADRDLPSWAYEFDSAYSPSPVIDDPPHGRRGVDPARPPCIERQVSGDLSQLFLGHSVIQRATHMRRDLIGAPESRSARHRDQATVTLRQTRPAPHIPEQHVIGQPGRRRPPGAAASPTLTNYTQAFALLHEHPAGHSAGDRSAMTSSEPPQLVRLPDGRRLAFADYGPRDGAACIVLSGMPAPDSRRPGRSPRACWPTTACAWSGSTALATADPTPILG